MPFVDQWQAGQHSGDLADAVAYGNGRFVMVAGDKLAWWSLDGVQWSSVPTDVCLHAITFGNGVFVAVGDHLVDTPRGKRWQMAVAVSSDGEAWATLVIPDDTLPDDLGFSGVGCGDGVFVAVGPRGRIYTATDPTAYWQAQLSATSFHLKGVGFGEGTFVTVGEQGTLLNSSDRGVTWQHATVATQHDLLDIAYGKGTFIATGRGGTILRSDNRGENWETITIEAAGDLRSIAYGHDAFVAVGDRVIVSGDGGRSWRPIGEGGASTTEVAQPLGTSRTEDSADEPETRSLTAVTYGQHRFIAVGPHGQLFQSERATAQLKLTLGSKPDRGQAGKETELLLTVANTGPDLAADLYVDLILQGDFGIATVLPSRGGYAMVNPATLRYGVGDLRAGEQANVKVVLLPQSRGVIELSTDAWADVHLSNPAGLRTQRTVPIEAPPPRPVDRWLPRVFAPQADDLRAATFGNGIWVAVGDHGLIMGSWNDGEDWAVVDADTDRSLTAIAHGPEGFVAVGEGGVILRSWDGRHWQSDEVKPSADLYGVACGSECMVAVGDEGFIVAREFGGGDWQRVLSPTTQTLCAITHGGHHFTAVGDGGTIVESPDGWAWSRIDCGEECDLRSVAHGRDRMVIATADGSILTQGGEGWQMTPCGGARELHGVCHGGGEYLAVGGIFTSSSGSDWEECNVGQIGAFYGCAYGNGSFVVVGPRGTIMQSLPVVPAADLQLDLQASPEVRRGQILRTHLTLVNRGPAPASRVTMTAFIPDGASVGFVNAVHGHCRQIGNTVYCELGDLHPGTGHTVVIGLKPMRSGPLEMQAVASGIGFDPDLRNDRAQLISRVVAKGAEIAVDQRTSRQVGRLLFVFRIENKGPGPTYEVTLTDPLPEGTVFFSASTSQGLFIVPKHGQRGAIVCQIGTVEAGEEVQVWIQADVEDRSLRRLTNTATLEATNAKTVSSTAVVRLK